MWSKPPRAAASLLLASWLCPRMSSSTSSTTSTPTRELSVYTLAGRKRNTNEVLYIPPSGVSVSSAESLVYFGGDVQDLEARMLQHRDNRYHVQWSLERTARLLADATPQRHVVVVRPAKLELGTFSCYHNFVQSNQVGVPTHSSSLEAEALNHLCALLLSLESRTEGLFSADGPKILVAFSKGVVVLNQMLYDFHSLLGTDTKNEQKEELRSFAASIVKLSWLDGGHNGGKDTWLTRPDLLSSLARCLPRLASVDIRLSPYQIEDYRRPWIRKEEKRFSCGLKQLGVAVEREVFFADEEPCLKNHFRILETLRERPL